MPFKIFNRLLRSIRFIIVVVIIKLLLNIVHSFPRASYVTLRLFIVLTVTTPLVMAFYNDTFIFVNNNNDVLSLVFKKPFKYVHREEKTNNGASTRRRKLLYASREMTLNSL